ncbi:MAG: mechanosensitive ion channel family protein [Deltaproteobacteria bacterium]|nr:mechanosensitive ion channel family protein [Deltaproteobacteria bacterium]
MVSSKTRAKPGLTAPLATFIVLAIALVLGLPGSAAAQPTRPAPTASASSAPTDRSDEEAVDSPRASVRAFLELCDRGRYELAERYLDLPRGAEKRGPELARKLCVVLGERLLLDPERLSGNAQGKKEDGLPSGTEELGKIDGGKGKSVAVRLVRHEARSPEDEPRWLFAQSTVQNVDPLYASLKGRWIRDHLPTPFLSQGPLSLYYWQWVAIPALAILCMVVGRVLASVTGSVARRLAARWPKATWWQRLTVRLARPVTLGWALVLFWFVLPYLALTLRGEDLVERMLRALGWLAFFWGLVRAVTIAGDEIADGTWAKSQPNVRAVTSVGVRLGKFIVGALALMVALSELGYPVTTVVAGLGIGGVALALAAQKTVENLFGSVSILVDQPFRVGDTIRVDGVEGAVETIGLRSTRLRTIERTLVIIPNGKLADMRIESLGPRDRIRFSAKLPLARDTTPEQLEKLVPELRARLEKHASVVAEDVFVRLSAIGDASYDVDVAAPIDTIDNKEFVRIREELLLTCLRTVDTVGAKLAVRETPAAPAAPPGGPAR